MPATVYRPTPSGTGQEALGVFPVFMFHGTDAISGMVAAMKG